MLGAAATGRPAAAQLPEDEGERNPQEALCSVLDELFKDEAACKTTLQVCQLPSLPPTACAWPVQSC